MPYCSLSILHCFHMEVFLEMLQHQKQEASLCAVVKRAVAAPLQHDALHYSRLTKVLTDIECTIGLFLHG